jgi:hypothetical protein
MTQASDKATMNDFLDGKPPFPEAFGNPDSKDDIRRLAGVFKDTRRQIRISGVLSGEGLPDHSYSMTSQIGAIFRSTVDLCSEIGDIQPEITNEGDLRRVIIWAEHEIGALIVQGKKMTDGEAATLERDMPHTAIMDGVRNSIFLESNPDIGKKYLLGRDEEIQVPSELDIVKIIYEVAKERSTDKNLTFYEKLLIDPDTDPIIKVNLGEGYEKLRLRQILAYYIFRNHAATRLRNLTDSFIKNNASKIIDFIGPPQENLNKVVKKIQISLMAMSSPGVAGALQDCYHMARSTKNQP